MVKRNITTDKLRVRVGATAGYVLTSDSQGNATWQASTGGSGTASTVVAGAGLTSSGVTGSVILDVNASNGLSISNDNVVLGGTISQVQTILLPDGLGARTFRFGDADGTTITPFTRVDKLTTLGEISMHTTGTASPVAYTYQGSTFYQRFFANKAGNVDMDFNPSSTFTEIRFEENVQPVLASRKMYLTDNTSNGYSEQEQTNIQHKFEVETVDPYLSRLSLGPGSLSCILQDVNGIGGYSLSSTSIVFLTSNFTGIASSATNTTIYSGPTNTISLDSSSDNILSDGTSNKRGLRYTGFGELDVDGTGASYSTLVGTSLVPKKYVDTATASIYNYIDTLDAAQITGVNAGVGLTGGGTAGTVTLDVNVDNGLSISGDNVELGGTLNKDTFIKGTGLGGHDLYLGNDVLNENLDFLYVYSAQQTEKYGASYPFSTGVEITKNPNLFRIDSNFTPGSESYFNITSSDISMGYNNTASNISTFLQHSNDIVSTIVTDNVSNDNTRLEVTHDNVYLEANTSGTTDFKFELDRLNQQAIFTDSRVITRGIEYAADYSAGWTNSSLITKQYVDDNTGAQELDGLSDVTTNFPVSPDQADDGKLLYYDNDLGQWTTSDDVTFGTVVIDGKKASAGTIAKGLPVYLVGFDSDLHTVELANAGSASTMPVIGFSSNEMDNTNSKHIITFGKLQGVDTTSTVSTLNPNGETWAVNDALYMSTTTGGLTNVRPTGGTSSIQRVAKVLKVDAIGGQLFIFNTARTAGLPNLNTDKLWVGDVNGVPQEVDKSDVGGNTIYSADDALTGNRIVDLGSANTLTFKNDGTSSNFRIDAASGGYSLFNRGGGIKLKPVGTGNDPIVVTNTTETLDTFTVKKNGGGLWSAYNGVKIGELSTNDFAQFTIDDLDFYKANVLLHRIGFGTNGSDIDFWINGVSANNSFRVGGSTLLDLESISLKGKTIIQGEGTTTGTTLALYDNDTTPTKTWEWLDNGNVNVNQAVDVNTSDTFNFVNGSKEVGISSWNVHAYWGINNGTRRWDMISANSSTTFNADEFGIANGSVVPIRIFNDTSVALGNVIKANLNTAYSVQTAGDTLIGGKLDMDNNRIENTIVNPSVQETTSTATFTINGDQETMGVLTAMATNTTIAAPTGTPVQGQKLILRFKDDGTPRTLTWDVIFRAIGVTLPTTTTSNKLLYLGFVYNSTDTKWDCVAVNEEA